MRGTGTPTPTATTSTTDMICGIGCDIAKISRFRPWVEKEGMISRFFNERERFPGKGAGEGRLMEWYAARFAAKEAFVKALGTGFSALKLADMYIEKNDDGRPFLRVTGGARERLESLYGKDAKVHVSLSHEKEYAVAFVIIERR